MKHIIRHSFFTLFAISTGLGCALDVIPDDLLASVNAAFDLGSTGCDAPCTVSITNRSTPETGASYQWSFGDGQTSTQKDPGNHTYTNPGNFQIRLIVIAGAARDTAVKTVSVAAAGITPKAGFTITNNNCTAACTVGFTNATTNGLTYRWDFGDPASGASNTSVEVSPSHLFSSPGTYSVKLVATNGSKKDSVTQPVTIKGVSFEKSVATLGPGKKAIQLADGGYMVAGTNTSGTKTDAYLQRFDAAGNTVGSPKIFNDSDADQVEDLIQLADGSFVIVGSTFNSVNGTSDILYIRTNATGTATTGPTRLGSATGDDSALGVVEAPDGNVVIVGYTYNKSAGNFDMFIRKESPTLAVNFLNKTIAGTNDETAYDVALLDDGGYMLIGTSATPGGSSPTNAVLMKLDAAGNKVAGFPKTFGGAAFESVLSVVKTASGALVMCGGNSGSNGGDVYFLQTDQNGNAAAGFPVNIGAAVAEGGNDLEIASDGFMIAGSKNLDAYVLKVDSKGVKTSDQSYGANGDDYFNGVSKTSDGGFIFTGGKINTLYLVKTNKDGKQ